MSTHPNAPSPDSWSMLVNERNVLSRPMSYGFFVPTIGLARPVRLETHDDHNPTIIVCDEQGKTHEVPMGTVPNLQPFLDLGTFNPEEESLATLQHRKKFKPEGFLRILHIVGQNHPMDLPPSEIRYGRHPDHLDEPGFYIGARHIGRTGLDYRGTEYLAQDAARIKYFPIQSSSTELLPLPLA